MKNFNPESFNHEDWESHHVGSCMMGNHAIYDFEIYKINGKLLFMCHDDPENLMTYHEIKEWFGDSKSYDDETIDEQLRRQGLI